MISLVLFLSLSLSSSHAFKTHIHTIHREVKVNKQINLHDCSLPKASIFKKKCMFIVFENKTTHKERQSERSSSLLVHFPMVATTGAWLG